MSPELVKGRKPLVYEYDMDVRFGDLDSYSHLNVKNYIDMVITARFLYMERVLKKPLSEITSKGIGFYVSKTYQEYLRPVIGMKQIKIRSFVEKMEGSRLTVPYEMLDPERGTVFSKGHFEFAVMDLKAQKPVEMPEWGLGYFLE